MHHGEMPHEGIPIDIAFAGVSMLKWSSSAKDTSWVPDTPSEGNAVPQRERPVRTVHAVTRTGQPSPRFTMNFLTATALMYTAYRGNIDGLR